MATAETRFSLRIENKASAVRAALIEMRGYLHCAGCSADFLSRSELILAEVLNNVVEHAFDEDRTSLITIEARSHAGGWGFAIEDKGHAMPDGRLPDAGFPRTNRPMQDLPEGGFGWAIVGTLAKDLQYRRDNGKNCLSFYLPSA